MFQKIIYLAFDDANEVDDDDDDKDDDDDDCEGAEANGLKSTFVFIFIYQNLSGVAVGKFDWGTPFANLNILLSFITFQFIQEIS